MNETKKGLRITAGILLLLLACLTLASSVYSVLSIVRTDPAMIRYYWQPAVSGILSLIVAILILCRKFVGAGIVRCLMLAVSVAAYAVSILPRLGGTPDIQSITAALPDLLLQLANGIPAILLIIGLFVHGRASGPLITVGAILALLLSVAQNVRTVVSFSQNYDLTEILDTFGLSVGISLLIALVTFVAWILLAAYFGAQNKKAA